MNREKALTEMIEIIKEFDQCSIWLDNEEQYTIHPATNYVGGSEGYYMCSELGNIQYDYIEEICNDLLDYIERAEDSNIKEITVD